LTEIQNKKIIKVGVRPSTPPFGYVDMHTRQLMGYDIDIVNIIAKKLGVKVDYTYVTSATRIPVLQDGSADMVCATFTKNAERAKVVDFSYTYFMSYQRFLIKKGTTVNTVSDLKNMRIGTDKATTSYNNITRLVPSAVIFAFDDYVQAFNALQRDKIAAITTDEHILLGLRAKSPDKEKYIVTSLQINEEPYGIAFRKGDTRLVEFVNKVLLDLEASGEADKLHNKWFGPKSELHFKRTFKIVPDKPQQ
jgi:polar amino acid transport system substrate-binding protein